MFQERDLFENIPDDHRPGSQAPPQSFGASPDGIGQAGQGGVGVYAEPASGVGVYAEPMGGPVQFLEPGDTSPEAALRTAGLTLLVAAVAGGAGIALGGGWGAVSGVLTAGGVFNVYRAQKWWGSADPSEKHEAVVSAVMSTVGIAAGGYAGYKAFQSKKDRS